MGEKQQRYRDRRLAEGWERVELLVPADAAPWLRAYAGALRSAASLGLPMPPYYGTNAASSSDPISPRKSPLREAAGDSPINMSLNALPDRKSRSVSGSAPPLAGDADADRLIRQMEARQHSNALADAERPDFSNGLLR